MMLTACGSEYDKVIGLDNGADDYMPKPFGMMELIARVKALLRRNRQRGDEKGVITAGDVEISLTRHTVSVGGENVELTYKEFQLLSLLMENRGAVFTRDQLLSRIWGYSFAGESRTVDVHVRKLRHTCFTHIECATVSKIAVIGCDRRNDKGKCHRFY